MCGNRSVFGRRITRAVPSMTEVGVREVSASGGGVYEAGSCGVGSRKAVSS